jgi:hypothetical protein
MFCICEVTLVEALNFFHFEFIGTISVILSS